MSSGKKFNILVNQAKKCTFGHEKNQPVNMRSHALTRCLLFPHCKSVSV
jgi:hypothetical protein